MDADTTRRLNALAGQLADALMTAAICAREIQAAVRTEIDEADLGHRSGGFVPRPPDPVERPLLDESTLSVTWKGRACIWVTPRFGCWNAWLGARTSTSPT